MVCEPMSDLKPAYLFTGEDEVKIEQARKRLAARAAADGAVLENLSAEACTPSNFAAMLTSPSLLPGLRIVLADGVEDWRAADVGPAADALKILAQGGLGAIAVLICRRKPLKAIQDGVTAAGGETIEFKPPGPKELPGWVKEQAKRLGVTIENAAVPLMIENAHRPKRASSSDSEFSSRRLLSELEKLAIHSADTKTITVADVEQAGSGDAPVKIFAMTEAAVAADTTAAIRLAGELVQSGEPPQRIVAMLARAFGQAQTAAELVERGSGDIAGELRIQPWLANKLAIQARKRGSVALARALVEIARLDSASKGGSPLDVETELFRSIEAVAKG